MLPATDAEAYALARRTLVDAVIALQDLSPSAFVLVGAHAVYLRAPDNDLGISAFTLDGDMAVNPTRLSQSRAIRARLEEVGFDLRELQSGLYERRDVPVAIQRAARVDIFVPAAFEYALSSDGYDARAVMVQPGLEACLVDFSEMDLPTIPDGGPPLSARVGVAGIVALLVAKGWKIGERHGQGPEAFVEVRKDIGDIYRLLRASNPRENTATLATLRENRHARESVVTGARYLRELCTGRGAGVRAFSELLGPSAGERLATASLVALVEEFVETVESVFAASETSSAIRSGDTA